MDRRAIHACEALSFADTPFPDVVVRLAAAGVVSYRADLIRLVKTYYDAGQGSYEEPIPLPAAPVVAGGFDRVWVAAAVQDIQAGQIGYAQFLRRLMHAGCASYSVFLHGRLVIYSGRDGERLVEPFPPLE